MTITLEEFTRQRREEREKEEANLCGCGCGQPLDANDDELRLRIDGRLVRADCWYAAIGTVVEAHPIHTPGRHGPGVYAHLDENAEESEGGRHASCSR